TESPAAPSIARTPFLHDATPSTSQSTTAPPRPTLRKTRPASCLRCMSCRSRPRFARSPPARRFRRQPSPAQRSQPHRQPASIAHGLACFSSPMRHSYEDSPRVAPPRAARRGRLAVLFPDHQIALPYLLADSQFFNGWSACSNARDAKHLRDLLSLN